MVLCGVNVLISKENSPPCSFSVGNKEEEEEQGRLTTRNATRHGNEKHAPGRHTASGPFTHHRTGRTGVDNFQFLKKTCRHVPLGRHFATTSTRPCCTALVYSEVKPARRVRVAPTYRVLPLDRQSRAMATEPNAKEFRKSAPSTKSTVHVYRTTLFGACCRKSVRNMPLVREAPTKRWLD